MSQCAVDEGWVKYFSSLPLGTSGKIEAESHVEKLASEGKRIFLGQGDIEMWRRSAENSGTSCSSLMVLIINASRNNEFHIGHGKLKSCLSSDFALLANTSQMVRIISTPLEKPCSKRIQIA